MGFYEFTFYKLGCYVNADDFNRWKIGGKTIKDGIEFYNQKNTNQILITFKIVQELFNKISEEIRREKESEISQRTNDFNETIINEIKEVINKVEPKNLDEYLERTIKRIRTNVETIQYKCFSHYIAEEPKRYKTIKIDKELLNFAEQMYKEISGLNNFKLELYTYTDTFCTL